MGEMTTRTGTLPEVVEVRAQLRVAGPVIAFAEAINRRDVDGAVEHLAPEALHHGKVSSYRPAGVRVLFGMLLEVFPDLRLDVGDRDVRGDRVVTRVVATGTHTGSFLGREPSGQPVAWQSIDIAQVDPEAGLILGRHWDLWSDPGLWEKIGFVPAVMC